MSFNMPTNLFYDKLYILINHFDVDLSLNVRIFQLQDILKSQ